MAYVLRQGLNPNVNISNQSIKAEGTALRGYEVPDLLTQYYRGGLSLWLTMR